VSVSDLMKRLLEMEIALSSPWAEEARKAHDEIERLTAVLDAARGELAKHEADLEPLGITVYRESYGPPRYICSCPLCSAIRAHDEGKGGW